MKQLIEFIPIALFGGVYFWTRDIFIATMVLMGGIVLQLAVEYWTTKTVSRQTQIIFWSAILLGGATLLFRNEEFLFWKPTIVNWIFSVTLLGFHFFSRENLLKRMLGSKIQLPDVAWKHLSLGWSAGFFLAGLLNLIVAFQFSLDFWVSYKLFGGFGLTLCYFVIMVVYLSRSGYLNQLKTVPEKTPGGCGFPKTETHPGITLLALHRPFKACYGFEVHQRLLHDGFRLIPNRIRGSSPG